MHVTNNCRRRTASSEAKPRCKIGLESRLRRRDRRPVCRRIAHCRWRVLLWSAPIVAPRLRKLQDDFLAVGGLEAMNQPPILWTVGTTHFCGKPKTIPGPSVHLALRLALFACSSLHFGFQSCVNGADSPPPVIAYRQYLQSLRTISMDFEYSSFHSGGALGPEEKLVEVARGSVNVRGNEFRFRKRARSLLWRPTGFVRNDTEQEDVATAKQQLHLQMNYPTNQEPFSLQDFPKTGGGNYGIGMWERNRGLRVENQDVMLSAFYGQFTFDDDRDVASFLPAKELVTPVDEEHDGIRVVRISGRGPYGTHTVWFDVVVAGVPRRIELRKSGNDLLRRTPLPKTPNVRPAGYERMPAGRVVDFRFDVGGIQITSIQPGDQPVTSSFETKESRQYDSGGLYVQRTDVRLSNVRFECRDADLEPQMKVPNGTEVTCVDSPGIKAEWRNRAGSQIGRSKRARSF